MAGMPQDQAQGSPKCQWTSAFARAEAGRSGGMTGRNRCAFAIARNILSPINPITKSMPAEICAGSTSTSSVTPTRRIPPQHSNKDRPNSLCRCPQAAGGNPNISGKYYREERRANSPLPEPATPAIRYALVERPNPELSKFHSLQD